MKLLGWRVTLTVPVAVHVVPLICAENEPFVAPPPGGPVGLPLSSSLPPLHANAASVAKSAMVLETRMDPPVDLADDALDPPCAKLGAKPSQQRAAYCFAARWRSAQSARS